MSITRGQAFDSFMVNDITDGLFNAGPGKDGFDLSAINMQRAREHGIQGMSYFAFEYKIKQQRIEI